MRTAGSNRLRGELAGNELRTRKEYISDRDAGFKQPLERCKLPTRWAFEYFDQTGSLVVAGRGIPVHGGAQPGLSRHPATARSRLLMTEAPTFYGGRLPWPSPSGRSHYIQIPTTAMLARPTSTSTNLNMRSVSCDGIGTSSSPINALRTKCATRSSILDISASMTSRMAT